MAETPTLATGLAPADVPDKSLDQLFYVLRMVHRVSRQDIGQTQFTLNTLKRAVQVGELEGTKIGGSRYYSTNDGLLWVAQRKAKVIRQQIESALDRRLHAANTALERQAIEADRQKAIAELAEIDSALAQLT